MIGYYISNNKIVFSSLELYNAIGRNPKHYYRWKKRYILSNQTLQHTVDYSVKQLAYNKKAGETEDLFISISLAKSLLINERTIVAKNVRLYIEVNVENKILESIKNQLEHLL